MESGRLAGGAGQTCGRRDERTGCGNVADATGALGSVAWLGMEPVVWGGGHVNLTNPFQGPPHQNEMRGWKKLKGDVPAGNGAAQRAQCDCK